MYVISCMLYSATKLLEITIHNYMHVCIHTCIHAYTHVRIHMYACIHVCMHTRTHAHTYACTRMHAHTYACMHAHTRMHACTHVRMHTYACTQIFMHMHVRTHIHIHTQRCYCMPLPTEVFSLPRTSRVIVAMPAPATLLAVRVYVPSSLYSTAEMFKVRRSGERPSSTVSVEVAPLVLVKVQTMSLVATGGMSAEMVNCRATGLPCTPMRSGVSVDTTGTAGDKREVRDEGREELIAWVRKV